MDALDRLGWAAFSTCEVFGARVGVRTNSVPLGAWMERALARCRAADQSPPRYSMFVGTADDRGPFTRRFHLLYRGITPLVRTRHAPTLCRAWLAELESYGFAGRDDAVYLRAMLVGGSRARALLPAALGLGLGRLGRLVREAGLSLPPTAWVAVDPASGRIVPPTPVLPVSGDALAQLGEFLPAGGEPDHLLIEHPATVDVVYVEDPATSSPHTPISRARALHGLAGMAVNLGRTGADGMLGLGRLAEQAHCYAVTAADSRAVLRSLAAVLDAV